MSTTLAPLLTGLAFEVPDLLLAQAWAEAAGLDMQIELDNSNGPGCADEVLVFSRPGATVPLWHMWRDQAMINVQPARSRTMRFARMSEVLERLLPESAPVLNDAVGLPPL